MDTEEKRNPRDYWDWKS